MTRYGIVVAYRVADAPIFFPADHADDLTEEIGRLVEDRGGMLEGPVDVAVRESTLGTGKLTSGQWGSHGI